MPRTRHRPSAIAKVTRPEPAQVLMRTRLVEADELVEAFYQHLIRCYQQQGRAAEARAVYERCRRVLAASLGTTPSPETEALLPPRPSADSQR